MIIFQISLDLFKMVKIHDSDPKRIFFANGNELNLSNKFPGNYLSTTKYNLLSFLPLSLFLQFRRVANIYFLITAILQSIPLISPLHPFSAIAPLVFVLSVSILREGVEDYLRYRSDKEVNSAATLIYKKGEFYPAKCQDIQVGNLVLVKKDQPFPCDLIMLANSNSNSVAYIETSSIDGEKNLKIRRAVDATAKDIKPEGIIRMLSVVECDLPNPRIYQFVGTLEFFGKHSLDKNNLLLAGAVLRNTSWAIGIATYTGSETKLRMNLMGRRLKQSKIERIVNKYIVYIISFQFCLCLICAILYQNWTKSNYSSNTYLGDQNYSPAFEGFLSFFTYFLLLNTILPISLIISLELLRIAQGFFMQKDLTMYSWLRDRSCKVSSFSLNEELGMIQHIFTDKTGTLTCNKMKFKCCSIGDKIYGDTFQLQGALPYSFSLSGREPKPDYCIKEMHTDFEASNSPALRHPLPGIFTQSEILECFCKCISLCHECLVDEAEFSNPYSGQSPDEITLLTACMNIGVRYLKQEENILYIEVIRNHKSKTLKYKKICLFEFDSDRKRNSIIVQDLETEEYILFIKGADNLIIPRLSKLSTDYLVKVSKDLLYFSEKGYRTLLFGYKIITPEEFSNFFEMYKTASTAITSREELIKNLAESIENNFLLLGCSAVEDSLQDEVPETIQDIKNAGINIWMLTGDKLETAVNIGKTCSLITEGMVVEKCATYDLETTNQCLIDIYKKIESIGGIEEAGLVIEGTALEFVFNAENEELQKKFSDILNMCKTVICCRVTPGQKKDVVRLVKKLNNCVTLAIGDGANDVSMILEAQVGIGLYGEEGMQAVQASDYAIGEFRFLWDLLFLHGRFNYIRQSETILYFIYKNLVFTMPQFYFAFYCAYSGQTVYDDWYITTYNMILTALPLMIKGIFEKDIKVPTRDQIIEKSSAALFKIRENVPKMYETGMKNKIFTKAAFIAWISIGIFHAGMIFFIPLLASQKNASHIDGYAIDFINFSITSFSCIIFVVNLKLSLNTRLWNIYSFLSLIVFSLFLYLGFIFVYDFLTLSQFSKSLHGILETYYIYLCVFTCISWVLVFDGAVGLAVKIFGSNFENNKDEMINQDESVERKELNCSNL